MLDSRLIDIFVDSFPKILIPGLTATVPLTAISFSLAMVIAVAVALVQYARVPVLRQLCRFYIWVIRGTPLLVQLFLVFYGLAKVGLVLAPFPAAVLVFSINEGAYCAETVRGALESIPGGQLEAGRCLGLTWLQTVRSVILPQAMRAAFPALSNSLIAMIKDTSLVSNITMTEMFRATVQINASVYEPLLLYTEVALVYLLFSTVLTGLQRWGEKRLGAYAL
jgi:cystine transport system permease protein